MKSTRTASSRNRRSRRFAREVLAGLPEPNLSRAWPTTSSRNPRTTDDSNKGDVRYDHYLGSRLNLFARYSHRELNQFIPPNIPGPSGGDSNGNVRVNNKQIAIGSNFTVSPTSMLEFRIGYSRTDGGKFPIFLGTEGVKEKFNIPNVPSDPALHRRHLSASRQRLHSIRCTEQQSAISEPGRAESQGQLLEDYRQAQSEIGLRVSGHQHRDRRLRAEVRHRQLRRPLQPGPPVPPQTMYSSWPTSCSALAATTNWRRLPSSTTSSGCTSCICRMTSRSRRSSL